jgi:hypothetical protein
LAVSRPNVTASPRDGAGSCGRRTDAPRDDEPVSVL